MSMLFGLPQKWMLESSSDQAVRVRGALSSSDNNPSHTQSPSNIFPAFFLLLHRNVHPYLSLVTLAVSNSATLSIVILVFHPLKPAPYYHKYDLDFASV
jgi:hypothetical protein